ncbi:MULTISPECIES: DUF1993 domain-containing protein [Buttiauxella]|jgi:hypothetical protein|uniref:DUF1993 domain-containing protein n=1 Tax=Buttiauxella ferragutiae ATCC 51602 TaxID=1354252 RepID=A0ABX2W501_9ENTR|nr:MULTISPECIES: DUF1993 domain-containing protein [Buttiauxella]MCE0824858.1 DUF1993 domain-containing protein [Buttiauxella ferragutiae]OAT25782.1 hypothetical protein M976_03425 [Buttiauxella ferragutiae ATCC 51602]TDN54107.1 hypothetical protein EC843_101148 [Buttiauxella sp. JUb87]UNK59416.1 DUF1993 domain-containing protein [Buttiauxella ferragutiae]
MSIYSETNAQFILGLTNLSAILEKAAQWAKENGKSEESLLTAALAEDMYPLVRQVQITTDMAKRAVARLGRVEAPVMEDNETTIAQLQARIEATIAFMKGISDAQLDGDDERQIVVMAREHELRFTARNYVYKFATPNFYFHFTTAYDILRQAGVPLGKRDFVGQI